MHILGIETSCDETAAAVVEDGRIVRSNIVNTQVALHRPYGGIVPELASRAHVENLPHVIDTAVRESGLSWADIDAVAATYGPGLASSLVVGLSAAKGLSAALGKPLIAVNHLECHIHSVFLGNNALDPASVFPAVALIVSGGHTSLVSVRRTGDYRLVGQTVDDAAGEALDKAAALLCLGYPGGPAIEKAGSRGSRRLVRFPRARQKERRQRHTELDRRFCFSFSGVKTSLLYYLRDNAPADDSAIASVAAGFQESIVDSLVDTSMRAARECGRLIVSGGVSINGRLRDSMNAAAMRHGMSVFWAERQYCTDNAAMVAGLAGAGGGITGTEAMGIDADPGLPIGQT